MLKIALVRARLGKTVSAKVKNEKDDLQRVLEFNLSEISLTHRQLSDLVACSKHERPFEQVAFVSKDAMSELRHFKRMELAIEVDEAVVVLDRIGKSSEKLSITGCTLKSIRLDFGATERIEMSCKVWGPLDKNALNLLGAWGAQDLYVAIDSKTHGEETPGPNNELDLPQASTLQ